MVPAAAGPQPKPSFRIFSRNKAQNAHKLSFCFSRLFAPLGGQQSAGKLAAYKLGRKTRKPCRGSSVLPKKRRALRDDLNKQQHTLWCDQTHPALSAFAKAAADRLPVPLPRPSLSDVAWASCP
jgi:hypothetical protein